MECIEKKTVLLVEDDSLIAMDSEQSLISGGLHVLKPVASLAEALTSISNHRLDFALLDYNLRGETSVEVAKRLREIDIPFVYVTGAPDAVKLDKAAPEAPVFSKPIDFRRIVDLVKQASFETSLNL